MSKIKDTRGRKPLPFSKKVTQVWTSIPMGDIITIEKEGYDLPTYLATAAKEKMQRDGLLQQ